MKLVAIFTVWDDWTLLKYAVGNMRPVVDGIIIIGSTRSNFGEYSPIPQEWHNDELFVREPKFHIPLYSETDKRNYGLEIAKSQGYTHFITCDADEFYKHDEFIRVKDRFSNEALNGLVCPVIVYFKSPTLTLGRDVTLVPHIHKLTQTLRHEFNRRYPHSWIQGQIRIDPSRSLNINSGVEYTEDIELHHFSWYRSDYEKKIRNSTARNNILKDKTLMQCLLRAKEGDYIEFYRKRLTRCPNLFGIHEFSSESEGIIRQDLQPSSKGDSLHPTN